MTNDDEVSPPSSVVIKGPAGVQESQPVLSETMPRNVRFFDASTGEMLGGVFQNGAITESNFLDMLDVVLSQSFTVRAKAGPIIRRSDNRLMLGDYDVYASDGDRMAFSDEPHIRRLVSHSQRSGRETEFETAIRARDGKCVFTGVVNALASENEWMGFEACHIFPLEKENYWIQHHFDRWITNTGRHGTAINSIQNGFLLQSNVHQYFDGYAISVNPDDGYKITSFIPDQIGVDGRILDPVCRDPSDPNHVSDHLLRWHFRQCVLARMRGAGERPFEHDFPPGSDMMKEISQGPHPVEHLEMEMFLRLREYAEQDFVH